MPQMMTSISLLVVLTLCAVPTDAFGSDKLAYWATKFLTASASEPVKEELNKFNRGYVYRHEINAWLSYIEPLNVDKTKELVVMIHGYPESAYHYSYQLNKLAEDGYWPIAVDLRGYGLTVFKPSSPMNPENLTMKSLADDIKATIKHLGRSEAIVIGHDFGCNSALAVSLEHPEMVKALMMLSIPLGTLPGRSRESIEQGYAYLNANGLDYYTQYVASDAFINEFNSNPSAWLALFLDLESVRLVKPIGPMFNETQMANPPKVSYLTDAEFEREVWLLTNSGPEAASMFYQRYLNFAHEQASRNDTLQMPYAFVMGENDPLRESFTPLIERLNTLPGYRFHRFIEGAAHFILGEAKEQVYLNIKDFLATL